MEFSKLKHPSILFIDSGIGGLSTLGKTAKILEANYIYFADNKYAPYGAKTDLFLKNRLAQIILSMLKKYQISMVVLACNTATTSGIAHLRHIFPNINFIGTEPAQKVALDKNYSSPAIIATPRTINNLSCFNSKPLNLISLKSFATEIEHLFLFKTPYHKFAVLKTCYQIKHSTKHNDCLVLGCTHYSLVKEILGKILQIPLIDGNKGVANQIYRLWNEKKLKKSSFKIILSNKNHSSSQKYKKILKQILANQINL